MHLVRIYTDNVVLLTVLRQIGIVLSIAILLMAVSVFTGAGSTVPVPMPEFQTKDSIITSQHKRLNKDAESTTLIRHARHYSQENTFPKNRDIQLSYIPHLNASMFREQKVTLAKESISSFLTQLRALLYPKHWFG